jgi:hypothetical protein
MTACYFCGNLPTTSTLVRIGQVPANPDKTPDKSGVRVIPLCDDHRLIEVQKEDPSGT